MKSFREFLNEADEVANKIVQFKRKLAGATDPAEQERLRKAIADAQKSSQKPPVQPPASSGPNTTIPGQPPASPSPNTTIPGQPKASNIPKPVRQLGRGAIRSLGIAGAGDAAYQASQGNYGDAAVSGVGAAMASRRLSSAVPRVQKQILQKVAPKLAPKLARFVPGLQQAYGITSGSLAAARGDKLGAALGYGSAIPGPIGYGFVAADISRQLIPQDVKKAIKDKTGITRLQQSKDLQNKAVQSGQGLAGIERAQQTMSTRDARKASTAYGTKQGSALTGLGGPAKVDTKVGTLTSQGKTVKLASTQLVRDPKTGQNRVGDLAYKGGKAVYLARPSVASRDTSLGANIQRALNIGRNSKSAEQQAAKTEYKTALKNTQTYTKGLGISTKSATAQKLPGYGSGK